MPISGRRVVVTGAGRDFGRSLAVRLAGLGAELFVSARTLSAAQSTCEEVRARTGAPAHAFACDLARAGSVRSFAAEVARRTPYVDVLVNNGARYLDSGGLLHATDDEVTETVASGATGTVLAVKHFLPLLLRSATPDIVTMVSACGEPGHRRSTAHEAFHAAKAAQGGVADILSTRLRPRGVRVISLYPPDFENHGESTGADGPLTAASVMDCIVFAISQPRNCCIKSFHFEQ